MTDIQDSISSAKPVLWTNPLRAEAKSQALLKQFDGKPIGLAAIVEARARFERFAPLLSELLPELAASKGQIESELVPVPAVTPVPVVPTLVVVPAVVFVSTVDAFLELV